MLPKKQTETNFEFRAGTSIFSWSGALLLSEALTLIQAYHGQVSHLFRYMKFWAHSLTCDFSVVQDVQDTGMFSGHVTAR